jgi:hypothetical protein
MGFQPMSGHIIRPHDRIMGWKPMPHRSEAIRLLQLLTEGFAFAEQSQPRLYEPQVCSITTCGS